MKNIPSCVVFTLQSVNMTQEMQQEVIDIMMTAMDKFASTKNNEVDITECT